MTGKSGNRACRPVRLENGMHKKIPGIAMTTLLAAWLALPDAALADPPPWAPAHGYRAKQYRYVYYPRHEVYYAPATQLWFWMHDGNWRIGTSLPTGIVMAGVPGVSVILGTERPYEANAYVVERYGGRHHERHRHHHDRDHN
jgi:hypothetical protein